MVQRNLLKTTAIISGFLLLLMAILRNTKSEILTILNISLGGLIFFTLLYYLFQTEKLKFGASNPLLKYLFFGISIPLLIYGVEATRELDEGFLHQGVRIVLALELFYLIFYWAYKYRKNIQTLRHEKLEAELTVLKNQINPHFFFNTLNNLYFLIKKDSDAAQDYVLKLSDLMRFTIYDSGKERVLLDDEVNYLINFIDLQTARYHKDIDVNFVKSIKNPSTKVAPLLFIVLLENAFKHGVEHTIENAFIHMELEEEDGKLSLTIKNNYDPDHASENSGIGLKNLKERLNLLYPNTHQLSYSIEENVYSASLQIHTK